MAKVIRAEVLYDYHAGGPHPYNVKVLFTMQDESHNGITQRTYAVLYDPSKPQEGAQQWIHQ